MCKNCNYVALHNHCEYSALDGFATIDEYVKKAKELNMIGLGLTDHGTMSGIYKFVHACKKNNLIPVPGIEVYVAPENPLGAKAKSRIYYGPNGMRAPKYDVGGNGSYLHLTLFAYNNEGLKNLFKLTNLSWQKEHFYLKPRIDTQMLFEHSEGIIATSGCPASEISKRFLLNQDEKAYEYARRMKEVFGDNYYVELMNHNMKNDDLERILIPKLIKLAKDLDIKLIATNDSHYAEKSDAKAHERMLAVGTKAKMYWHPKGEGSEASNDTGSKSPSRFAFSGEEYYIKSYEEMLALYPEDVAREALENTKELTEKCKSISLDYDPNLRPKFKLPEGYTNIQLLKEWIKKGFQEKRGNASKELKKQSLDRVKMELEVIHGNDFVDFFLILADIIKWSIENGIPVGRGRGSAAGSEIGYLLNIHDTDPLKYDLLFERFLSPGRGAIYTISFVDGSRWDTPVSTKVKAYSMDKEEKLYVHELTVGSVVEHDGEKKTIEKLWVSTPGSSPDIDTDFLTTGRKKVINYIKETYGEENVANIITFNIFKSKSAFKSMCTIYGKPSGESQRISNTIPEDCYLLDLRDIKSMNYNLGEDYRNAIKEGDWEEVVDYAEKMQGRISHSGIHACGVIISAKPLLETIPTQIRQDDNLLHTQWTYPECESLGLLKMDILGLETVDIQQDTLENIAILGKPLPNLKEIGDEPTDKKTYKLFQNGDTNGIFQFTEAGVKDILRLSRPTCLEDLSAITALYRPGPMSTRAHLEWALRKNGTHEAEVLHPEFKGTSIERILEPTQQMCIYQEQTMKISQEAAGFTSHEADTLRKAMGKKKLDVMLKMKDKFITGLQKHSNISKSAATLLWDTLEGFSAYAFNKSHSTSYALNSYICAYLKANYPVEFMSAILESNKDNNSRIARYVQDAISMGLKVGPIDINNSNQKISPSLDNSKYDIVYGLAGVKNVNPEISREIVEERKRNGPYKSVEDFISRTLTHGKVKKNVLENLAAAGAFDCFGVSRKSVIENSTLLINKGNTVQKKGISLFDLAENSENEASINLKGKEYAYLDRIKKEVEVIRNYISGHPLDKLGPVKKTYNAKTLEWISSNKKYGKSFQIICTISAMESKTSKTGRKKIQLTLDDKTDTTTVFLSQKLIKQLEKGSISRLIQAAKKNGEQYELSDLQAEIYYNTEIDEKEPIELNDVYLFTVKGRDNNGESSYQVLDFERLYTSPNGALPFRIQLPSDISLKELKEIVSKIPKGGLEILVTNFKGQTISLGGVKLNKSHLQEIESLVGYDNFITKGV